MSGVVEKVAAQVVGQTIRMYHRLEQEGGIRLTGVRVSPATMMALRLAVVNSDIRYAVTDRPVLDQAAVGTSGSLRRDLSRTEVFGIPVVVDDSVDDGGVQFTVEFTS